MTKVVLVGIMGVSPEVLFGSEISVNVRQLMEIGSFGPLVEIGGKPAWTEWLTLACGRMLDGQGRPVGQTAPYDLVRAMASLGSEQTPIWDWIAKSGGDSLLIVPSGCEGDSSADHAYVISREPTGLSRGAFDLAAEPEAPLQRDQVSRFVAGEASFVPDNCADCALFRARYVGLRACLEAVSWAYVQLIDDTLERLLHNVAPGGCSEAVLDWYLVKLDEELGRILQTLDDDTVFALVSLNWASAPAAGFGEAVGAYVIAGPDCPVGCGPEALSIVDVAPTLLASAGYAIPTTMQGKPQFERAGEAETDAMGFDQRELELLRERLSGLGYIG